MTRHIDFDAIENFRDFGGYATGCGRGLVSGRLYRSGHHALATDQDLARLQALGVAIIVDLRQATEREREPSRRWGGFEAAVVENDILSHQDWVAELEVSPLTAESLVADTMRHYRINVFEPRLIDLFGRFLRAVGDAEGAVVVHCAAGKDRTGLACAFLHQIAGVHHDDMIADYLLTNDESRLERKMAQAGAFVERVVGRRPSDEALRAWVQVYPEYLDAAFDEIRGRCGSIDRYLADVLGVDAEARDRIGARVLGG
ncbi:tyrosine-protein phosphatase [Phenylobacterium sp.]|uniref:tyrosine-protein phosphatase n=1 Tax=Phenylobacterium sp. TaxID=1871053 RepID=UPI0025E194CA|nr:tyrosine-protein phosphatase [Phenylobacterium sp.]